MRGIAAVALLAALAAVPRAGAAAAPPGPGIGADEGAVARGRTVFAEVCRACHGLRYLGERAQMPEGAARAAFGKAPPDLSLMALARGRGGSGAAYIAALLGGYTGGAGRNAVLPGVAMPPPFAADDPDLRRKAADVAAYLLLAADPHAAERRRLGRWVVAYLAGLTTLLFLVNRRTWAGPGRGRGCAGGGRGLG